MTDNEITPQGNHNKLNVLEAKINIILLLTGGQFIGFVGIILTLMFQSQ